MDGPENEFVIVAITNENKSIFYWSHLSFCNSDIVALSTMNGEMHGGMWGVQSLMVVENGAIGFARMIFSIPAISPQQAWSMDASHSTGTNRVMLHSYSDGEQASEGVVVGMGLWGEQWTVLSRVPPMLVVGHYS
jgi:hypothetical protein